MPSDQFFSLPLEQQVGQFFFIGLPGTTIDAEARELIEEVKPGGIILFGRNVESPQQVRELLDDARALVPTPPLVGIDQEGGLVDRLRQIFPVSAPARSIRTSRCRWCRYRVMTCWRRTSRHTSSCFSAQTIVCAS